MPIEDAIEILEAICPEVYQQGSLPPNKPYPVRFFTYWNPDTSDHKHYDNAAFCYVWVLDVNFYSEDSLEVYTYLEQAQDALQAAGWMISGKGHAVASDKPSHTGRGFSAMHMQI